MKKLISSVLFIIQLKTVTRTFRHSESFRLLNTMISQMAIKELIYQE